MQKSKYFIRVMRPTFARAILAIEAVSEKAAIRTALEQAGRLTDDEWKILEEEPEPPVVEIAIAEEETEGSDAEILAFLRDVQHAYALLQANLAEGAGAFIVPDWLRRQPDLAIADITQDWDHSVSGIHREGVEAFIAWLARQTGPTPLVSFFAEREKRRGKASSPPTAD